MGVTGGLGCGKSEVGRILGELGVQVLDTDELVHEMLDSRHPVGRAVADLFGAAVVRPDGCIDRQRVARRVFADPEALTRLNALVHPAVLTRVGAWVAERRERGEEAAVLIPLLFEAGADQGWDAIVCVSADEAVVLKRLQSRGWTEEETRRRLAAQWPLAEKEKRADYVLRNNGGRDELRAQTARLWEALRRKKE